VALSLSQTNQDLSRLRLVSCSASPCAVWASATPAAPSSAVERRLARQAQRAFERSVPFAEAFIRVVVRVGFALLAAEANVPFILPGFQSATVGFFGL
jgi:hypothetical protein